MPNSTDATKQLFSLVRHQVKFIRKGHTFYGMYGPQLTYLAKANWPESYDFSVRAEIKEMIRKLWSDHDLKIEMVDDRENLYLTFNSEDDIIFAKLSGMDFIQ